MRNALTIDLEDWYHPELVRHQLGAEPIHPQLEQSTRVLLDLLAAHDVKATVFLVGEVVQRHPNLIRKIVSEGHEIGCHGMSHRPLWEMTPEEFRTELREFGDLARAIVPGVEVIGFRAPTFSLENRTRWALDILTEFGYYYDSSVFPLRNPVYGVGGAPLAPYRPSATDVACADAIGQIVEFPMSVWAGAGIRLPVCGGFYLRALPFRVIRACLRRINRERPFVVYAHPWEAYPQTPRMRLPFVSRFVTYYNIGDMLRRIEMLLQEFSFAPMRAVLNEMGLL